MEAVNKLDMVISIVGSLQIESQVNIIKAIKEVGTIKRSFPSVFGNDVGNIHTVEPAKNVCEVKEKFRRAIEAEGIPYTYVSSNSFAGYFLASQKDIKFMSIFHFKVWWATMLSGRNGLDLEIET